ncbi:hypothetical protein ACQP1W_46455 [Spirillospora sp. CA-255316]
MASERSDLDRRITAMLAKPVMRKVVGPVLLVLVSIGGLIGLGSSFLADDPTAPDPCTRLTSAEASRFVPQAGQGIASGKERKKSCEWRGSNVTLTLRLEAHKKQGRKSSATVARTAVDNDYDDGKKHTERRRARLQTSALGSAAFARTPPAGQPASYATVVFHRSGISANLTFTYAKPGMTIEQAQAQAVEAAKAVYARLPTKK